MGNLEQEKINWCIEQHQKTNHNYDNYLPYAFHLRMVAQVAHDFMHLYPNRWTDIEIACFAHDLIEDCRVSYNDCKKVLGEFVADIVYAVSNEKGKNRAERANDKYYEGIRNTEGAVFVKLCDRIANVQYSILTKSKMREMYLKENRYFITEMATDEYMPMIVYLNDLFKTDTEG